MTMTNYPADRTALLIVDPYNDFMSEGGKLYEATRETAEAVGFYDHMRKLIPAIRAARIQVIIVPHHRWEGRHAAHAVNGPRFAHAIVTSCSTSCRPELRSRMAWWRDSVR